MEVVCFFILIIMFPFSFVYADYQVDALIAFKTGLSDPDNALQSWDPTLKNPCTCQHVTCDSDNNVVRIDLGDDGLAGPLVAELGNLSSLQYLEMYNNKINGSIPKELGKLVNLVSLDLSGNNLIGSIPQELGDLKNLKTLQLNDNNLSGEVPFPAPLTDLFPVITTWSFAGNPGLCGNHTNRPDITYCP